MNRPTNADLRAAQFRLVSMGRVRNHRSAGESWTRLDLKVWIRRADSRPSFGAEVSNAVRTSSTASVYSNASQESDAVPVNGGTVIGKADMVMVMKLEMINEIRIRRKLMTMKSRIVDETVIAGVRMG
jgi:hypothetical protein